MLMKPLFLFLPFILTLLGNPDSAPKEKIQWLTLQEATERMKNEPRPIIIDLYARWCYWCKVMDKRTYKHDKVANYINKKFYAVKIDAETKETIQWKSQDFTFDPETNMNEFSLYMTNGQLSFPTTVIYTSLNEAPAAIPGFMSPDEIEPVLKYFGEDIYRQKGFDDFLKNFKKDW